ncbi:hypothetical protein [Butyrivibrio virus Bo-Finn]|nr:hypothetical protein [Butyrivibrio virus Bo-Finn]
MSKRIDLGAVSAYAIAVENGFEGTEAEWLESLKGEPGAAGAKGEQGVSAYEIAVDNGFAGSAADWLASLKGEKGDKGDKGDSGSGSGDGSSYDDTEIRQDIGELDEKINERVSYNTQYIDNDLRENGYYYSVNSSGAFSKIASDDYYCLPVIPNIKAGTFYGKNISGNFTIVQNVETEAYTKLSNYASGNVYTIPFDFNLFVSHGLNAQILMFADGILPNENLHGKYNITVARNINLSKFIKNNNVFYCGANREITNICEAIETAKKYHNSVLYVDAGNYDLKAHFEEYYGASYFTNYSRAVNDMGDLKLGNGLHIIFASNAILTCDLSNVENTAVNEYFSPFNTDVYSDGYTLENMHLTTKNCRYAIHDEFNGMETPYHIRFINCHISHDSSGTTWGAHQAIGGGLGASGDVVIDGCYLNAVGYNYAASYHNSAYNGATDYKSRVTVKNCYFDNGTFYISNFGQGTKKSEAYVSNNSFPAEPTYNYNPVNGADNAIIVKWNNEIRQ